MYDRMRDKIQRDMLAFRVKEQVAEQEHKLNMAKFHHATKAYEVSSHMLEVVVSEEDKKKWSDRKEHHFKMISHWAKIICKFPGEISTPESP